MKFSLNKFIGRILPPHLRSVNFKVWMNVLISGLQVFRTKIEDVDNVNFVNGARYTSQYIIFNDFINKIFPNNSSNKIIIVDNDNILQNIYTFNTTEPSEPIYIHENNSVYTYSIIEFELIKDFLIKIPTILSSQQVAIIKTVEKYKNVGVNYEVEIY
jgi:hypothetical protein